MSILENVFFPLKDVEKIRNEEQSKQLIDEYVEDYADLLEVKNHKKNVMGNKDNVYRFTCKLLSLDLLTKLSKDKRVKNVFYAPSAAPPGGSIDSISLRFKVFIEYY